MGSLLVRAVITSLVPSSIITAAVPSIVLARVIWPFAVLLASVKVKSIMVGVRS